MTAIGAWPSPSSMSDTRPAQHLGSVTPSLPRSTLCVGVDLGNRREQTHPRLGSCKQSGVSSVTKQHVKALLLRWSRSGYCYCARALDVRHWIGHGLRALVKGGEQDDRTQDVTVHDVMGYIRELKPHATQMELQKYAYYAQAWHVT